MWLCSTDKKCLPCSNAQGLFRTPVRAMKAYRHKNGVWLPFRQLLVELKLYRCWFCDARGRGDQNLCQGCESELPVLTRFCLLCALPLVSGRICGECTNRPPPWESVSVALRYEIPVDHLIQQFKYNHDAAAGKLCGQLLAAAIPGGSDTRVMAVPMHRKRFLKRGFNHAEVLARDVARARGWTCLQGAERVRETQPQYALDPDQRRRNVRDAFSVEAPPDGCPSVVLVDDIYTTGETLRALARACRTAGYRNITVACLARGGLRV